MVASGLTVPNKFRVGPVPGVPVYVQSMCGDILVNPPDVPGHVLTPLCEADHILLPIFAPLVGLDGAASNAPPADIPVYGKPDISSEFAVAISNIFFST